MSNNRKKELLMGYKRDLNTTFGFNAKDTTYLPNNQINDLLQKGSNKTRNNTSRLCSISDKNPTMAQKVLRSSKKTLLVTTLCVVLIYVILNLHQTSSSIVLRNVQCLTYSTLRIIRILSVPTINIFPSVTELYDESCLIENPKFHVLNMECWPCRNVHSVIDLTGTTEHAAFIKAGSGTPFITKINQSVTTLDKLWEFYQCHSQVLNRNSMRFKSRDFKNNYLKDFFGNDVNYSSENFQIQWRINKMASARYARKLFPRPFFISERSGQSVERYIVIDRPKAKSYSLPSMECHYVFIIQASGERNIVLKPSKECENNCRTVSVLLKPSYALWYNWWYWRPISLPTDDLTSFSITYVNSYC